MALLRSYILTIYYFKAGFMAYLIMVLSFYHSGINIQRDSHVQKIKVFKINNFIKIRGDTPSPPTPT